MFICLNIFIFILVSCHSCMYIGMYHVHTFILSCPVLIISCFTDTKHILHICTYVYTYIHISRTHTQAYVSRKLHNACVFKHTHMPFCVLLDFIEHAMLCMFPHWYIHIHMYMHTYMHICIYLEIFRSYIYTLVTVTIF